MDGGKVVVCLPCGCTWAARTRHVSRFCARQAWTGIVTTSDACFSFFFAPCGRQISAIYPKTRWGDISSSYYRSSYIDRRGGHEWVRGDMCFEVNSQTSNELVCMFAGSPTRPSTNTCRPGLHHQRQICTICLLELGVSFYPFTITNDADTGWSFGCTA